MFPSQLLNAYANYGNPIRILGQRLLPGCFSKFEVKDRRTGVTCTARPGAERLFNEIWFDHDYDLPGVELRAQDVVLDIGGNQGFYACYAAFHGATVFSFEPETENLKLMRSNLERNGLADRVTIIPKAVKKSSGTTAFFVTPMLGGGMQTTIEPFANQFKHSKADDVPCVSLSDHLAEYGLTRLRLCKLDCEGAELEIIESLTPDEAARIDGFVIEFHPEAYALKDLIAALEKLGTHHLMLAPPKFCVRNILWAISHRALRETTAHIT